MGEATITLASEKDGKSATVKVKVTEGDRELGGTIVDSNLQYPTADKYETVKSMSQRTSETLSAWKMIQQFLRFLYIQRCESEKCLCGSQ